MQLFKLGLFIVVGFLVARIVGVSGIEQSGWYMPLVASLLAIGLYASTYGIDLAEARQHLRIIVSAVTIGVLLKAVIISGTLALLFQDPFFLILGVVVAQIDPLSVASLMKGSRMSAKAKTILASWASFDDPITVILSLYAPMLVMQLTGVEFASITGSADAASGLAAYAGELGLNLLLAGTVLVVWLSIGRYGAGHKGRAGKAAAIAIYILLAVAFSLSVWQFMMLAIALVGLIVRPPRIAPVIDQAITWALRAAAVLLGVLLIGGISLWKGIALGVMAYAAQIIVGFLLTRGLPEKDRWHIAFAQQNGITAIILALLFESVQPGTVAVVAPAIIVINSLHGIANKLVDKRLAARYR